MSLHNQNVLGNDISTGEIQDGAVTAVKLATDAVETAKIKDANVTAVKLATDAVETAKIKNANVTIDKVPQTGRTANYVLKANAGNTELEFGLASVDPASNLTINGKSLTVSQWMGVL